MFEIKGKKLENGLSILSVMKNQGTSSSNYIYENMFISENYGYVIRSSEDKEFGHMLKFKNKSIAEEFKKLKDYSEKQDFIDKHCLYISPYRHFTESDKEGWVLSGLP